MIVNCEFFWSSQSKESQVSLNVLPLYGNTMGQPSQSFELQFGLLAKSATIKLRDQNPSYSIPFTYCKVEYSILDYCFLIWRDTDLIVDNHCICKEHESCDTPHS